MVSRYLPRYSLLLSALVLRSPLISLRNGPPRFTNPEPRQPPKANKARRNLPQSLRHPSSTPHSTPIQLHHNRSSSSPSSRRRRSPIWQEKYSVEPSSANSLSTLASCDHSSPYPSLPAPLLSHAQRPTEPARPLTSSLDSAELLNHNDTTTSYVERSLTRGHAIAHPTGSPGSRDLEGQDKAQEG